MKSKLLLSLGLVAILGMAQTVEAASDIDVARFILAKLSPEQRTALFAEYASQETAVPVIREESYTQPKWIEEQFGKGYRGEDVDELRFMGYGASANAEMCRVDKDGKTRGCYNFKTKEQTRDLLRAVIHGFAANAETIHVDFDALDDNLTKEVIDHINNGGFSNVERLILETGNLASDKKALLEQALLNIRSSKLKSLWYNGGSFEFAQALAETKNKNPKLCTVTIMEKLPEGLDIVRSFDHDLEPDYITHDNGVIIGSEYKRKTRP